MSRGILLLHMGWNGEGVFISGVIVGLWFVTALAQFALLRMRRTQTTSVVSWVCLTAQIAMLARAVQVNFLLLAAVCAATTAVGLLVRRRWVTQRNMAAH